MSFVKVKPDGRRPQSSAWSETVSNLDRGVVELEIGGEHWGNGLLVTQNGYFLTNWHCFWGWRTKNKMRVRDYAGNRWRIECICETDPCHDIALAKIDMSGPCLPMRYRYFPEDFLRNAKVNTNLIVVTRWNGSCRLVPGKSGGEICHRSYGKVRKYGFSFSHHNQDELVYRGAVRSGDSGGVLVAIPSCSIIGLHSGSSIAKESEGTGNKQRFCSLWRHALAIIYLYCASHTLPD